MAGSAENKYKEIVSRLTREFSANNQDGLKKDTSSTQQDFIKRGLSNSTVKVSKLLELHYQYLDRLIDFLTDSIEKNHSQLRPSKCTNHIVQIVEKEYEKLKNKVPGWLRDSQLLDKNILATYENNVISKKSKAIEGLENKCVLWEDRWRRKRSQKRINFVKWLLGSGIGVVIIMALIRGCFSHEKQLTKVPKPAQDSLRVLPVDPNTGKTPLFIRTKERVDELKEFIIKEKIDPWLFIRHSGIKVTKDDGTVIESSGLEYAGSVINIFWSNDYIDPFLSKGIKRIFDETGCECKTNGIQAMEPLKEAAALLNGIIFNVYGRMAEVDFKLRKQRGDSEKVFKKRVDGKIKVMHEKVHEHLQAALELYSDQNQ
jgi:hypothetical protein